MIVSSFTRSFLTCYTKRNATIVFARKAISAAKKRHPDLKLEKQGTRCFAFVVPSCKGCTLLLIQFDKVN